jgi:hypothetical protein
MSIRYDENTKARAVRLVREHRDDYDSEWAAIRRSPVGGGCARRRYASGFVKPRSTPGTLQGCQARGDASCASYAARPGSLSKPSKYSRLQRLIRPVSATPSIISSEVCVAKVGPGLPSQKRQQVWEMWKVGRSISEISRTVGSPPGSIFSILLPYGGIYQPPQRRRPGCLSLGEREEISRGLAAGQSYRVIGERLGRGSLDDQS